MSSRTREPEWASWLHPRVNSSAARDYHPLGGVPRAFKTGGSQMGNGVVRRMGATALLAVGLLGGALVVSTPPSEAHTCAKLAVNSSVSVTAGGPPDCVDEHLPEPNNDTCHSASIPAGMTTVTIVVCLWMP